MRSFGQPAPKSALVDVDKRVAAYFLECPDPSTPTQRVAFGTSGHRGSAFDVPFNERHLLTITQASGDDRKRQQTINRWHCGSGWRPSNAWSIRPEWRRW